MVDIPSGSLIGTQLASLKPAPGALTLVEEPVKRKNGNGKKRRKKGKRPPPAESLYG